MCGVFHTASVLCNNYLHMNIFIRTTLGKKWKKQPRATGRYNCFLTTIWYSSTNDDSNYPKNVPLSECNRSLNIM